MSVPRLLLRLLLGSRLPKTSGDLRVPGLAAPIAVRRDKWGVPHIEAANEADAWFALGFCQAQDRGGQLEVLWRVARGNLAEWVGVAALGADRMSRRIGFFRSAISQWPHLGEVEQAVLQAYVAGINAGFAKGLSRPPHEFALLGGTPAMWEPADVLAVIKLQTFMLPSNWDAELARLRILLMDGPDAVRDLDPVADFGGLPAVGSESMPHNLVGRLADDLAALQRYLPPGGGSNNWVIAGNHTASGSALLANDPHLAPTAPAPWYLAHLRTPEWELAGAGLVGAPGFPIGHNGFAAWGMTAGLTDNTDFFIETLNAEGNAVREADGSFTPCETVRETIRVKKAADVVEEVLLAPRGPVLGSNVTGIPLALSLRAVWLDALPVSGFLRVHHAHSFEEFRRCFAEWPAMPLNVVYADAGGSIGWQLVGQLPRRPAGNGLLPRPADAPDSGWDQHHVAFEQMPFEVNPECGFIATANGPPPQPKGAAPFLGADFVDSYRTATIRDELTRYTTWDLAACVALQQSVRSMPWEQLREAVLALDASEEAARDALALLRDWDGRVDVDSPAAAVFELFTAEMCVRVAKVKAPHAWRIALGESSVGVEGHNLFADRRMAHLVELIRTQPVGWFARSWAEEMLEVLGGIVRRLRRDVGPGPAYWAWGHMRQLKLVHPLFEKSRLLGPVFNLGPVPIGGDANTISQAGSRPADPTAFTHNMANLRSVFDLADLSKSVFVLCGGQSGNPCSPHFADQFPLWQAGETITLAWDQAAVIRGAKETLRLLPGGSH